MEGVCFIRLAVPDLGHVGAVHGDDDGGKSMTYPITDSKWCTVCIVVRYARPPFQDFQLTRFPPAAVGASLLRGRISDRKAAFFTAPNPIDRVYEPSVRRYPVLCDQSLRSLCERCTLQPTGTVLFLAVLFLHEFYLDCGSILSVYTPPNECLGWRRSTD